MKRYIKASEYYDEDNDFLEYTVDQEDFFEDVPDDEGGSWTVELYKEKYADPVYKHFSTGQKALQYAKKVQERYKEIYINKNTSVGPLNRMAYQDGRWQGEIKAWEV